MTLLEKVPKHALSIGLGTILKKRKGKKPKLIIFCDPERKFATEASIML